MKMTKSKKIEIVRLDLKEKNIYRAFIPDEESIKFQDDSLGKIVYKDYLNKEYNLKIKQILQIDIAEERFGYYVCYKS